MKEQTLSPAERCPALSVDSKPLGVLDVRIGHLRPRPPGLARAAEIGISLRPAQKLSRQTAGRSVANSRCLKELLILPRLPGELR